MAVNKHTTHGHAAGHHTPSGRSKTYSSWHSMRERCLQKNNKNYGKYGGRGITICPEWDNYNQFLTDMGEVPPGLTLERIDNEKGYSPENCKWADRKTQMRNRTVTRRIEFNGEVRSLSEWAEIKGISPKALSRRFHAGWEIDRMLTTPTMSFKEASELGLKKRWPNHRASLLKATQQSQP